MKVARPLSLPSLKATQTVHTTLRFGAEGPQIYSPQVEDILRACGGMAVLPNQWRGWACAVRIHRVRVYAIDTASFTSVSFRWGNGGIVGLSRDMMRTDQSLGIAIPACIETTPPKGSAVDDWMNYSTSPDRTVMDITVFGSATVRSFVDIELTYDIDTSNPALVATPPLVPTLTSLTVGNIYWPMLDNVTMTNQFRQLILPTFA